MAEHQLREVIKVQGKYINNELDGDGHGRQYKPIYNLACKKKGGIFATVYTLDRWATETETETETVIGRFGASHNVDLYSSAFTIL